MALPVAVTRFAAQAGAKLVKHAPTILTATGLVSMTAGTGLAIKKSFRYMELVSEPGLEHLVKIEETMELSKAGQLKDEYTEQEYKQDKIHAYILLGINTAKHYAVPAALFVGGVAMVISGHAMQLKRLAAVTAAYAGLHTAYENLRGRIAESVPEEDRRKLFEPEIVDDPEEQHITVTPTRPYEYIFDDANPYFHKHSISANETFLESALQYANDKLCAQGFLFLNDVLEMLGIQPNLGEGAICGWTLDSKNGDGVVVFGEEDIFDLKLENPYGDSYYYTLNFNVQGPIVNGI